MLGFVCISTITIIKMCIQTLPDSPYQLEEMVNHVEEESSSAVKLQLLTAMTKLFFKRPAECQHTLGRLLEHAVGKWVGLKVCTENWLYSLQVIHVCLPVEVGELVL